MRKSINETNTTTEPVTGIFDGFTEQAGDDRPWVSFLQFGDGKFERLDVLLLPSAVKKLQIAQGVTGDAVELHIESSTDVDGCTATDLRVVDIPEINAKYVREHALQMLRDVGCILETDPVLNGSSNKEICTIFAWLITRGMLNRNDISEFIRRKRVQSELR